MHVGLHLDAFEKYVVAVVDPESPAARKPRDSEIVNADALASGEKHNARRRLVETALADKRIAPLKFVFVGRTEKGRATRVDFARACDGDVVCLVCPDERAAASSRACRRVAVPQWAVGIVSPVPASEKNGAFLEVQLHAAAQFNGADKVDAGRDVHATAPGGTGFVNSPLQFYRFVM
jgi:hypothetical protein